MTPSNDPASGETLSISEYEACELLGTFSARSHTPRYYRYKIISIFSGAEVCGFAILPSNPNFLHDNSAKQTNKDYNISQ